MARDTYSNTKVSGPDFISGGQVTIDSDHWNVHRHNVFSVSTYSLSVANSSALTIGIYVPTGTEMHLKDISITGFGFPFIVRASFHTTFTPSATYLDSFDHHQSTTPTTANTTCNLNPTALPSTWDYSSIFGGGTGVASSGTAGGFNSKNELILHPGNHIVSVLNSTGSAAGIGIVLTWYEMLIY